MTRLCVPISVTDLARARRDVATAIEAGAEILELRIDRQTDAGPIILLIQQTRCPCIVTCRASDEGGHSEASDEGRLRLLAEVASGCDCLIDIEWGTLTRTDFDPAIPPGRLIISAHDFAGRPERLHNLVLEMSQRPAMVNKIVWTARTIRDNLEAFELIQRRQRPSVVLCMGEQGIISRILARKFGAFLTFASLSAETATAPGQLTIAELKSQYRWEAIGPRTKLFGVVGNPVSHSMSPALHNAAFSETGFDGLYLPLLVNEGYESFKAFIESFLDMEGLDLSGLSITIPHKENALRYLLEQNCAIDPLAMRIGAVNTMVVRQDRDQSSRLLGLNTDYGAILDCLTTGLGIERSMLSSKRVAVIGAGGTGRTAVAALASRGATVVIYNRTRERADSLAAEFNGQTGKVVAAPLEKFCEGCFDIYINTSSIGMHPHADASPFGQRIPKLSSENVVMDAVYNPIETLFVRQARLAGARTIIGLEMFVRQAAAQFETWTGLAPPIELMRSIVERRLATARRAEGAQPTPKRA